MTDWRGYIDVTGCDPVEIIRTAFAMSVQRGLGLLEHRAGDLTADEEADLRQRMARETPRVALDVDYLRGRAVKLTVFVDRATGRLYLRDTWFDHGPAQLADLIDRIGIGDGRARVDRAVAEQAVRDRDFEAERRRAAEAFLRGFGTDPDRRIDLRTLAHDERARDGFHAACDQRWFERGDGWDYGLTDAGRAVWLALAAAEAPS